MDDVSLSVEENVSQCVSCEHPSSVSTPTLHNKASSSVSRLTWGKSPFWNRKRVHNTPSTNAESNCKLSLANSIARHDLVSSVSAFTGSIRKVLRRRVSINILRHKLNRMQNYSLPFSNMQLSGDVNKDLPIGEDFVFQHNSENSEPVSYHMAAAKIRRISRRSSPHPVLAEIVGNQSPLFNVNSPCTSSRRGQKVAKKAIPGKDSNLQQKIDHEIRMREGSRKLLAACHHSSQQLEAARSLLCSNNRIMAYMSALQQRKTQEALGHTQNVEGGNQLPCKARLCVSDIRIPLMWKDTDHFKNKGDYRRYAVFCLLKVGTEIFDTALMTGVDRSMTDITFENAILFEDIPHDFELSLELYCHKLHEELSVTNTPKKIRKTITSLSGSVGRSVGKRLSGLNDADVVRNMVLGPRFDLVAKGTLGLTDVDSCVQTFDFCLQKGNGDSGGLDLPLFGNYCCRLAAVPHCLFTPAVTGYLNLQEEDGDMCKWRTYWCVLGNLQIGCWSSSSDHEVAEPLRAIPVNKSTQISDADPNICRCPYAFLIKTASVDGFSEHTLAADSKTEVDRWWLGFQQHLLDQALWKHTCDSLMEIKAPTKSKVPSSRTSSLYDETPLIELETVSDSIVSDFKMSDDQLSHMLTTLMGEANEIRGIHQS